MTAGGVNANWETQSLAQFRYEISPVAAGWQVSCNGTTGPAFADRNSAVRDTLAIAATFIKRGSLVEVRLFDIGGAGSVLEPKDAHLFVD